VVVNGAEVVLHGGVANAGAVVRVGDHVLRPSNPRTPQVHRFLAALHGAGFVGVPLPVGVDPDGRERLEYVTGEAPLVPYPHWSQTDDALESIAGLLRAFHHASEAVAWFDATWSGEIADPVIVGGRPGVAPDPVDRAWPLRPDGAVICHNDVCPENVVFRDGRAVALLDFDFAAPARPVFDLGQLARMCIPVDDDQSASQLGFEPADRPARLRLVADAYGLDAHGRQDLLDVLDHVMAIGGTFVQRHVDAGEPGFVAMWAFIGGMARFDRRRDWWAATRARFAAAMG
jgi:Phosphotransferase enzyme family